MDQLKPHIHTKLRGRTLSSSVASDGHVPTAKQSIETESRPVIETETEIQSLRNRLNPFVD